VSVIDWNSELKKIERQFDGLPPDTSTAEGRERRAIERREKERVEQHTAAIAAWIKLALVIALAAALNWWPYPRTCGTGLYAYLGAEAVVVIGGLWAAAATWGARMPRTHVLAMAAMFWGFGLLAIETLPRIGYAKADPGRVSWSCAK
jgi:hypothetical protein